MTNSTQEEANNTKMNKRDQIVSRYFSELGKRSAEVRKEMYGDSMNEKMRDLSHKAAVARAIRARRRALVVNLDNPERNCKICGGDHAYITDDNRAKYTKLHEKHIRELNNGRVAE